MVSGAGHDSMEFARAGVEAILLFVPSRDGISHSPDEFTSAEALWTGVRFASALLDAAATEIRP
jgi:allantoate deiminase